MSVLGWFAGESAPRAVFLALSSGPRCAVRVGVRIRPYGQGLCLSSWFWCSCSLPCAFVCGYAKMGKDCACLFVVLVPVGSAVRTCVRIRLAEYCGAPQLQFVDQVETSLLDNRDRYAQCFCAFVSCMVGVSWSAEV